jgi:hypothetical protein
MIERVRAVLVTPDSCLLAIRRDRPDRASYWVLPGGHVDTGDQSLEAAGLTAIDLKPGAVAELLRDAIGKGRDLVHAAGSASHQPLRGLSARRTRAGSAAANAI